MQHSLQKGAQIGTYRLGERLWKGSFGETWKASDNTGESVAIQFIQQAVMVEQMRQQPSQLPTATTSTIAQLLVVQLSPPAFIWQYMSGRRLATFVKELGRLKLKIAVHIARKLLEILTFSASKGMVHGGLRPTRILINAEKNVVITNCGVGYWEQRAVSALYKSGHTDSCKNIIPYFAPEVLEDQLFDDPKSDVYAMGMVLAEMLLGQRPAKEEIPSLFDKAAVPKSLAAVVFKAIADFEERYHHPQQMYDDLTHFVKPVKAKTVETIYIPPPNSMPKAVTLEAIPADSEEYRVYQAQMISARQTIDAEVMAAEPAENDEGFESVEKSSKTARLSPAPQVGGTATADTDLALQRVVAAFAPEKSSGAAKIPPIAMQPGEPTSDEVLNRLDHEPIWPTLFGKYTAALLVSLIVLTALTLLVRREHMTSEWLCPWPLLVWQGLLQLPFWGRYTCVTGLLAGSILLLALPWLDTGSKNRRRWLWSLAGLWFLLLLALIFLAKAGF
jgi:serine/threonine protein kinase